MAGDIDSRASWTSDVTRPCKPKNDLKPDDDVPSPRHLVKSPSGVDTEQPEDSVGESRVKGVHLHLETQSREAGGKDSDSAPSADRVGADDAARKSADRIANHGPRPHQVVNKADLPRVCKADKAKKGDARGSGASRDETELPDVTCRNRLAIYMDIELADQMLKLEEEYLLKQAGLVGKWEEAMGVALGRVTELGRSRAMEIRHKLLAFEVKKEGGLQFKQLLEEVCNVRERFQPVSPILDKLHGREHDCWNDGAGRRQVESCGADT
ncbi:uncharacterized protein MAM_04649 [Metarhizium album ARSEF 1941]|uniref:Uncharacterized protein n=1 Tax=Metarhizium album (strain ARSEF 1941) TaxID=1081103 RepID=A0A0B2WVI4_METAS|nr:uncharacterized protein MAM_04649 [Metarhizium album ARSEF 1941]KHN97634.1 hypothetical protein MAM_04649 [Metarhizium album ARSEF 1941]